MSHDVETIQETLEQQEVQAMKYETANQEIAMRDPDESFLMDINRAVISGQLTSERMHELLDIKKWIVDQRNLDAFNESLAQMQPELPIIETDRTGDKNAKYASYGALMEEAAPIIGRHGFALTYSVEQADNKITVTGKLRHKKGHFEVVSITLPLDTSGSKNAVQAVGSTLTYGKRYAAGFLLNLATKNEDDDGADAGKNQKNYVNENQMHVIDEWISKCDEKHGKSTTLPLLLRYMRATSVGEILAVDYKKAGVFLGERAGELNR